MTYYITMPGYAQAIHAPDIEGVIELKPYTPMIPQLLKIPTGADIMASPPGEWPTHEKERFALKIHEALINIEISRNTINAFKDEWEENAFWNYEAAMSSFPVDQLPAIGESAIVIGSGPSAKEYKPSAHRIDYAAWSAPIQLAHYVGHCDHREPAKTTVKADLGIIFTPCCSPSFLKEPFLAKFVYFDRGNRVNWRFAEKRNLPDHEPIVGHVVDMLAQCAIYAGHKKIAFIGVDLSCKSLEDLKKYHGDTQPIAASNYRGETVYTDEIFLSYQSSLEGLADRYPEIEFTVASDQGVILEGIPYEPL